MHSTPCACPRDEGAGPKESGIGEVARLPAAMTSRAGDPGQQRRYLPIPEVGVAEGLVQVRNVSKTFGNKEALRGVSFAVPPGQICGLLGPNGAGKTTLFRLLMGIVKATDGTITVAGLDAFADRVATKRLIGFVPDEPVFFSYLSGWETLRLSAAMHGLDERAARDVLGPLIERMGLDGELDRYAEDYSRGTKKKLALLLAVLHRPRLLVLDEPTNGLDVEATELFHDLVREQAAGGATVLFSTHLMHHVARLCSRAVVISRGTVVADDAYSDGSQPVVPIHSSR